MPFIGTAPEPRNRYFLPQTMKIPLQILNATSYLLPPAEFLKFSWFTHSASCSPLQTKGSRVIDGDSDLPLTLPTWACCRPWGPLQPARLLKCRPDGAAGFLPLVKWHLWSGPHWVLSKCLGPWITISNSLPCRLPFQVQGVKLDRPGFKSRLCHFHAFCSPSLRISDPLLWRQKIRHGPGSWWKESLR